MNFQYCYDRTEILQYAFLDRSIKDMVSDYEESFCIWYYDDATPVSLALYGMNDTGTAYLLYMATATDLRMMGHQSALQREAEEQLAAIGVTGIKAFVNTDGDALSNALSPPVQQELLEYYGFEREQQAHRKIIRYKNNRESILQGLSPRDFLKKVSRVNEIINERELSDSYIGQLYRVGIRLSDGERGMFAVSEGAVRAALIFRDSGIYDLKLERIVNLTEGQSFSGALLTAYIVTHTVKNRGEYLISAPGFMDLHILNSIMGTPLASKEILSFAKRL